MVVVAAAAADVTSLLGHNGNSRVRPYTGLGGGLDFRGGCNSGAVFERDHSLLAAIARPGTVFRAGGRHWGLTRGRSQILISSLI